jgi:hypothetical protein
MVAGLHVDPGRAREDAEASLDSLLDHALVQVVG